MGSTQHGAADAAIRGGLSVYWEPATERLADSGFGLEKYPSWGGSPYDINELATSETARGSIVDHILTIHPENVTHVTAPHFYVTDERSAHLNVTLVEMTRIAAGRPVRAILTIGNKPTLKLAETLAREYVDAGIAEIELRLSPLGGEDESLRKIQDAFRTTRIFRDAGLWVTLGHSGNIGHIAVALGHADAYSVGVGMFEQVNYKTMINRQKQPPRERTEEDKGGGASAGIYLPGLAATVPCKAGRRLLENTDIRTSIGCRTGSCSASVRGPGDDPRGHYLHARANEMSNMLDTPAAWRATLEVERLKAANELRRRINRYYLDDDVNTIKTRTIMSLVNGVEAQRQAS